MLEGRLVKIYLDEIVGWTYGRIQETYEGGRGRIYVGNDTYVNRFIKEGKPKKDGSGYLMEDRQVAFAKINFNHPSTKEALEDLYESMSGSDVIRLELRDNGEDHVYIVQNTAAFVQLDNSTDFWCIAPRFEGDDLENVSLYAESLIFI